MIKSKKKEKKRGMTECVPFGFPWAGGYDPWHPHRSAPVQSQRPKWGVEYRGEGPGEGEYIVLCS